MQVVPNASKATIEAIIDLLPGISSITVYVYDMLIMDEAISNMLNFQLRTGTVEGDIKNADTSTLKFLLDGNHPKLQVKEATFYLSSEMHSPVNIKLSPYAVNIEYWDSIHTTYVADLFSKMNKFDDIDITISKHLKY